MHLTTHVEGDKYQGLLKEKGFGGFPTLAFMDAEGNVLTQQGERSVKGFTHTLNTLKAWQAAKKKAEAGDKDGKKELFLAELGLGKLKAADARAQLKGLEGLSKDEIAKAEDGIHGLEIKEITDGARTPEAMAKAAAKLLEMHKAGTIPPGQPGLRAYGVMIGQGMQKKDWQLCDELVAALKARAKGDANAERAVKTWEDRIAKLKGAPDKGGDEAGGKK